MKTAVILAAGVGSRLRPITNDIPKSCVEINGVSLLERIITQLHTGKSEVRIIVVAGFQSGKIEEIIESKKMFAEVVINADYENTNNMESCRIGLELSGDSDCIIVNADCIYDDEIVHRMIASEVTTIAVDSSEYFEENMKVRIANGAVVEMSKKLLDCTTNITSIDLYHFKNDDKEKLLGVMKGYRERQDLQQWTEVAIDDVSNYIEILTNDFNGLRWVEIDNHEDLEKARRLWA